MRLGASLAAGTLICFLGAAPASAQDRGFVRFLAGPTFGTAEPSTIFGGGGGFNLSPAIQVTGEFGRMQDILPSELQDFLDTVVRLFELETGIPLDLEVAAPALYGMGGVRYTFLRPGRLQPFVDGQFGVASISFKVKAEALGIDISDELEEEADLDSMSETIIGFGGGVGVMLTDNLGVDLGYRYHRIFTEDPAVNVNAIYGALRLVID